MPTEVILEVAANTRYRRMPVAKVLEDDRARQKHCDRTSGHILQIQHCGIIRCRNCDATWKDEGF